MPLKNNTTSDSQQRLTSFLEAFDKAISESIPNNNPITDSLDNPQPLLNRIAIMPNNDIKKNSIEMALRSLSVFDHLSNKSQRTFDILSKIKTSSEKQLTFVLSRQSPIEAFAELKIVVESKVIWDIAAKNISQKGTVSIPITNPNILDDPSLLNLEEINGQYTSEIIVTSVKEIYQNQENIILLLIISVREMWQCFLVVFVFFFLLNLLNANISFSFSVFVVVVLVVAINTEKQFEFPFFIFRSTTPYPKRALLSLQNRT